MDSRGEVLEYMRAVLEGRENLLAFARWFRDNEDTLQQHFSRGSYLRLKLKPISELRRILEKENIPFTESRDPYSSPQPADYSWVKSDWLTERVFPFRESPAWLVLADPVLLHELLHMVEIKKTGDELWHFLSPSATWESKMGRAGIALVRDRKVIYAIVTLLN